MKYKILFHARYRGGSIHFNKRFFGVRTRFGVRPLSELDEAIGFRISCETL